MQQLLLQTCGKFAAKNLRGKFFDGVAGVLGGGQPTAISPGHETQNMFDGPAKFCGMIEKRGVALL
jgi:hypothetical protein